MKKILYDNRYFVGLLILFVLIGSFVLMVTEKGDVLRWLNQHHNAAASFFFKYATYFGAELVPVIIVAMVFVRIKYFFVLAASNVLTSVTIQFLKRMVFSDYPRPSRFFKDVGEIINVVEGVELHDNFSFPSGHSASAFALFFGIALCIRHKVWGSLLFFCALAIAFSRIYLVQHFFMDIYTGAVIACTVTFLVYWWFDTRVWYSQAWANRSPIRDWNWGKRRGEPKP